jgi:hypothetical protein
VLKKVINPCRSLYCVWILVLLVSLGAVQTFGQTVVNSKVRKDTVLPKIDTLKAAVVVANMRPRMKGDTIEYNTGSMVMRKNSVVEELLRRLPGLQIDANGNITFNGEKIQHLLVDGEDIFGSDPTLVMRNFDASKVARVQILDRRSDQAVFTGVGDGTRTKALNLVMKEGAKNGYFGKVEAGHGFDGYYNASAAVAAFQKKEQFTALGFASNTGTLGFNAGAGGSAGVSFLNGNADPLGASAGTGVPRFEAVAIHYANTWGELGDHLMANYQYSHFVSEPLANTVSVQTLADSVYSQTQRSSSVNQQRQNWMYGIYDLIPSRSAAFKLSVTESNSQSENRLSASSQSDFNDTLVNSSHRDIRDKVERNYIYISTSGQMIASKGRRRTISGNLNFLKSDVSNDGYIYSINRYYLSNGRSQESDTVDQRKHIADHSQGVSGSVSYTEAIWRGAVLGITYNVNSMSDNPLQATFNKGDGKYEERVDSLSSQLHGTSITHDARFSIQGKYKYLNYNVGGDGILYEYRQIDVLTGSSFHISHFNYAPRFSLNYSFNPATSLQFNYNSFIQPPNSTQLQPILNNSDPLHITVGNPALKPAFKQGFVLNFHRFKTWTMNLGFKLDLVNNDISLRTTTDSLGRQVSQSVNVDGTKVASINGYLGRKLAGMDLGIHFNSSYNRSVSFVNFALSNNDGYSNGGGVAISQYIADKYSFQLNTNFVYFNQISSINTSAPIHYWTQNHSAAIAIYLIRNYELNTSATYTWQEKTSAFAASTSVVLWNGFVSRNFLNDRLSARVQMNNILNQNAGISRTNANNVNTQTSTNILGRSWMLSLVYHFDKKFKQK